MLNHITTGLLATLAYGAVGIVLLGLGYLMIDLVTPGRLGTLIWTNRNRNAAVVLVSGLLAVGTIITTAIVTSADDLGAGLASTAAYGVLGLLFMALGFLLLDVATPGKLGALLVDDRPHPAIWVSSAINLALGAIIAAAIS
ncbi:MAG: DUF350 domain-containing protein [Sciscionella sp.]